MQVLKKITLVAVFAMVSCPVLASAKGFGKAKNIIFMVPDGMGISNTTAARIFANGPNGDPLSFETLPQIGYQRTHSRNSLVTDSAAAASAWACGEKYNNGEISCHDNDFDGVCDEDTECTTPLEMAKALGKATGVVSTSDFTHATPAVWGAHVHNRKCEYTIAEQMIKDAQVDVILGGGIANNRSSCLLPHTDNDDISALVSDAEEEDGYTLAFTREQMLDGTNDDKLIGIFNPGGKTPELFRVDSEIAYPEAEPTLAEMTEVALDILDDNRRGFFLMVEGSQIDWADHANDLEYQIAESLGFDAAVQAVKDWINAKWYRRATTLLIVVADHDTAGFAVNGPYGSIFDGPGHIVEEGWTSGGHTAEDVIVYSQGPGSRKLGAALDNTDLYYVMEDVLK